MRRTRNIIIYVALAVTLTAVSPALPSRAFAAGMNIGTAETIEFETEYSGMGEYKDEWYQFTIPERGTIELTMSADYLDSGSFWLFRIWNAEERCFLEYTYRAGQLISNSSGKIGLPAGTYYLDVETIWNARYYFKVSYEKTDSWEVEQNNNIGEANPIVLGRRYYGSDARVDFMGHSGIDWFKFTVDSPQEVSVIFGKDYDYRGGRWEVSLYDIAQNRVNGQSYSYEMSELGDVELLSAALEPGIYFMKVDSHAFGSSYHFTVEPIPDDDSDNEQPAVTVTWPMHRLYNPYTGEHFYTASEGERDGLVAVGWSYEGVGWVAPAQGQPVYRLYNPYAGDHHYTTSTSERYSLAAAGWVDEGIGWRSAGGYGVPLYRQYNPFATVGTHNYTTSREENDSLVAAGWQAEGVGWYGVA